MVEQAGQLCAAQMVECLYQASTGPELIPIEVDLDRVKRSREEGLLRLGQPLKSFRDRRIKFDIYGKGKTYPYLNKLGTLNETHKIKGNSRSNATR